MFKLRMRKIMFVICVFTLLFVVYQLSDSLTNDNSIEGKGKLYNNVETNPYSIHNEALASIDGHILKDAYSIGNTISQSLFKGEKIVHMDLKGAPLKVSYLKVILPLLKSLGATGLLMEYEDMFPYSNTNIPASNSFSKEDIKTILKIASENNLEVIPLVQTFGHLEFVLKLKEFDLLREVSKYPQVVCPVRNGTDHLLKGMIDDIINMHPTSIYLHIGCDEVYYIGECNQCLETMLKKNWTKQQLFLNHVTTLARYIKEKYPNVKVLTWDDEFRKMSTDELIASNIGSLVEPVVWKYTPTVDTYLPDEVWDKYSAVFGSVWIASSFKGATGPNKFVTDISYHLENHQAWMKLVAMYSDKLTFKGIMMTGWQRYDHFAVLCELFPVGLPSLAVNLAYISQGDIDMQTVPKAALDTLKCGPGLLQPKLGARCNFPGSVVYDKANELDNLMDHIAQMKDMSETKGWLTEYNIETRFSSPAHVESATSELDQLKMELTYLERDMRRAMDEVFFPDTAQEWVFTYITPLHKQLQAMWDAKEQLLAPRVWPRRPLVIHEQEL